MLSSISYSPPAPVFTSDSEICDTDLEELFPIEGLSSPSSFLDSSLEPPSFNTFGALYTTSPASSDYQQPSLSSNVPFPSIDSGPLPKQSNPNRASESKSKLDRDNPIFQKIKKCMQTHWKRAHKSGVKDPMSILRKNVYNTYPEFKGNNPNFPTKLKGTTKFYYYCQRAYQRLVAHDIKCWLKKQFTTNPLNLNKSNSELIEEIKKWSSKKKWSENASFLELKFLIDLIVKIRRKKLSAFLPVSANLLSQSSTSHPEGSSSHILDSPISSFDPSTLDDEPEILASSIDAAFPFVPCPHSLLDERSLSKPTLLPSSFTPITKMTPELEEKMMACMQKHWSKGTMDKRSLRLKLYKEHPEFNSSHYSRQHSSVSNAFLCSYTKLQTKADGKEVISKLNKTYTRPIYEFLDELAKEGKITRKTRKLAEKIKWWIKVKFPNWLHIEFTPRQLSNIANHWKTSEKKRELHSAKNQMAIIALNALADSPLSQK